MTTNFSMRPETPFGADRVGGVYYPRVKLSYGPACDEISDDNPLPVAIISGGAGWSSGGLTDAELRAAPVPVSGTFYPATQPVSGTVTVGNASLAVTGTFWQATQPVSGTVGVSGSVAVTGSFYPATQPVSIAGSVAVTGSFYQTTQPVSIAATVTVSGPLTDAQLRAAAVPVSGTFYQATQPVSIASMPSTPVTGTFWQATQPISGTVTANINGTVPVSGTFWQATQPVSIAATVPVRQVKDTSRTQFSAATVIGGVTAVSAEALLTMVPVRAGVASGTVTSQTVTNGKTLRITAIIFSVKSTSAAVLAGVCALRMNPNGAVTASSPILAILSATQQAAALAQAGDTCVVNFPDGIELSGTMQFGLTQLCSAATGVVFASIIGFEY